MIISIDAEKAFDKFSTPLGTEGTYLNTVKTKYDKPIANIILNGEKLKAFPLKSERGSTFTTIIQHSSGSPSYSNQSRERIIWNPDQKRSKALTADDMILYIEKPTDSIRKLLELISEFSKVAGYKINTQKSLAFLYTNNEESERESKE